MITITCAVNTYCRVYLLLWPIFVGRVIRESCTLLHKSLVQLIRCRAAKYRNMCCVNCTSCNITVQCAAHLCSVQCQQCVEYALCAACTVHRNPTPLTALLHVLQPMCKQFHRQCDNSFLFAMDQLHCMQFKNILWSKQIISGWASYAVENITVTVLDVAASFFVLQIGL